ncbi:MAG: phenylalanine--tRNA ligase beta subunit-related protein, partial [Patescibacteria group bacterium]
VTDKTKTLILESANFNASHIRKTSERLGIKTDASKRFENKLSPEMASVGMNDFSAFLFEMDKNLHAGDIVDVYPKPQKEKSIAITEDYIVKKLGVDLPAKQIEDTFSRLLIKVEKKGKNLALTPPVFRMDLDITEDISEEVGRIIGYDKIPSVIPLTKGSARVGEGGGVVVDWSCEIPKSFYYEWKIREVLIRLGFSEVMTSSFAEKGSVAIEKPLAEDKKHARENVRGGFEKALKMNVLHAPILGDEKTCIFEIGRIFTSAGEKTALAIGVVGPKKKSVGILEFGVTAVSDALGVPLAGETKNGVFECVLDTSFEHLPEPNKWDISIPASRSERFTTFSVYPFIVRDVALFVSNLEKGVAYSDAPGVVYPSAESVAKIMKENAGNLVVHGPELFDEFTKDGKKSLAFRLVFQSFDRTLTDKEVNDSMGKIYAALTKRGWQIR